MRFICLILFLAAFAVPAYAEEASTSKQEAEVLALLKITSGYVGSSDACKNDQDAASALNLHDAILDAAVKNKILLQEDAPYIREMGRKNSNETLSLFKSSPPVSCAEVHSGFSELKASMLRDGANEELSNLEAIDAQASEQTTLCKEFALAKNYAVAVEYCRKGAESGYWGSQFGLGMMYTLGRGVPQDYAEALKWLRKSADQGFASAQNEVGVLYWRGKGVPQDYAEALKWFRKAADQGDKFAYSNLGRMYAFGNGVLESDEETYFWLNLASAIDPSYSEGRDLFAKGLSPQALSAAQKRAREWKPVRSSPEGTP